MPKQLTKTIDTPSIDTSSVSTPMITPIALHLELTQELSEYQERMMKRYGESVTGNTVVRVILIPSDMPLHNLHYAIQKLFGWQNSHLRKFLLPTQDYDNATKGTVRGWIDLIGTVFQAPMEYAPEFFWDDDYSRGNFNTWLKKRFIGPYKYRGPLELPDNINKRIEEMLERYDMVAIYESFDEYHRRPKEERLKGRNIVSRKPFIELTVEELNDAIFDIDTTMLLERLEVNKVLASPQQSLGSDGVFPLTRELLYNYDYGDDWFVTITKLDSCDDLLMENKISLQELGEAVNVVVDEHKPVCIYKEGTNVMDDVGNLGGYADLLGTIYEEEDKEERNSMLSWAKMQGWSEKKSSCKTML